MLRDELKSLIRFDPDQLRAAIQRYDQEAAKLASQREEVLAASALCRQILLMYGEEGPQVTTAALPAPTAAIPAGIGGHRFRAMKWADAAVVAIGENGGRLHAKKILEALAAGGKKAGGKWPMSTLINAMKRDQRIERDPTVKNTWRLVKTEAQGKETPRQG
jgi:hypothetical protein